MYSHEAPRVASSQVRTLVDLRLAFLLPDDFNWHVRTSWLDPLSAPSMTFSVTAGAERNQILHVVPAELAPRLHVMNLQSLHGTAVLAPPTISFQHSFSQHIVFFRLQLESWLPLA